MEDLESMLASIRSAAIAKGPQWLRAQLSGLLPGLEPVTATPAPEPAHAGRSQPPVRSNPEPPPRGCRRPGSPILDPSASPAKRTPALWSGGAGRNPLDRRTPGGERGSSPSSQTTSADQRDLAAYTAGVLPAAGVAWPGRASSTGADPMPGADETASGGSSGTTGGGAGVATPELDQRTASAKQTAQRKRRAVASDFFSQPPWEKDGSEGELTTSKEGAVDTKNFFSRLPLEKDRSEGELTTLEEGAMDASDVFSQMPGLPSEEDGSEGEQATLEEGAADTKDFFSRLPWEKDRSEDELTTLEEGAMDASDVFSQMPGLPSEEDSPEGEQATLEEGAVDAEDDPLPGSNTGLQGSGSAAVLSGVAGKPESLRVSVGNSVRRPADSGDPVIFTMNALAVEVPIHSQSASNKGRQPRHHRPESLRVCVGYSMRRSANSGNPVVFAMNARAAEVPIHSQSAANKARQPRHHRPESLRVCVGYSIRRPALSGNPVVFAINARAAEVPIHSQSASTEARSWQKE
ncbi:hypothetical protein AB205_0008570 [Aquarana catesbeiana]|uniref:Uncharacterized protein n=1 Tax=Aquarana catesbeiana TaxID=8400 RepID=A0A2G9SHK6_AQUCT|nr:hypothetical protein AB205_0008570 [Aquarana catesbeiana]